MRAVLPADYKPHTAFRMNKYVIKNFISPEGNSIVVPETST
jgi:hypothetical protein